jgi:hypothetical protein
VAGAAVVKIAAPAFFLTGNMEMPYRTFADVLLTNRAQISTFGAKLLIELRIEKEF